MAASPQASASHFVLIPSFNPGARGDETVRAARAAWNPVWVVVDGSTDGSAERLSEMARHDPGLRVFVLPHNRGKGAAVLFGAEQGLNEGFSHALTLDADGQHPVSHIERFMRASEASPAAMILGAPVFETNAPRLRVVGRRISNGWANFETLWSGIDDSLFGFRVYPLAPLCRVMRRHGSMRHFDFDPEIAVRLCWEGVTPKSLPAPVRYFSADEGGVSHFSYLRDNLLLTSMHIRLLLGFLWRLPGLWARRTGH
jgi:glycosyltransferase involved in cell wall biosynthesis